jgi:large subunit ribosomal protein L21
MYAILRQGGHQYRVEPGDRLLVERLPAGVGSVIALEPVLLLHDGTSALVDATSIDGARVPATVLAHRRGRKLRVFKYKPKKRYRRTLGYRSDLTELRIETFLKRGEELPAAVPEEAEVPDDESAGASAVPVSEEPEAVVAAASEKAPAAKRTRTAPAVERAAKTSEETAPGAPAEAGEEV